MFYLPVDLFSPYIKGREYAIDRNWNDLNQSNQVEQGWLNNDAQQLKNWFTEDTYGDNLSRSNAAGRVAQNQAAGSDMNLQLAQAGQPGALAQAQVGSDYQVAAKNSLTPYIPQIANNNALFTYGQSVDSGAQGRQLARTAPTLRQQQANNNVNNAGLTGQQIQAQSVLTPMQLEAQQADIALQNQVRQNLMNNPDALFPQTQQPTQTQQPSPVGNSAAVNNILAQGRDIPIGQSRTLIINGTPVSVGRDTQGLFINGSSGKQYIGAVPQGTGNSVATW